MIRHTSQLKPYAKAKQAVTAQHDIRHSLQTILTAHQHSFKALNADAMAQDCRQNKAASHKIEPSRALVWPCEHQIAQQNIQHSLAMQMSPLDHVYVNTKNKNKTLALPDRPPLILYFSCFRWSLGH